MREGEQHLFITLEQATAVEHIYNQLLTTQFDGKTLLPHEQLLPEIKKIPLINKTSQEEVGILKFLYDLLFNFIIKEMGRQTGSKSYDIRRAVVSQLGLKSMAHYHHESGSKEPLAFASTRDDFYNDPRAALAKFTAEIPCLAEFAASLLPKAIFAAAS